MPTGGCHCGAIRYEMPAEAMHCTICHCSDCRRHAGAPMVAWAGVGIEALKVTGEPRSYRSSKDARREFCGACGTGLFYFNAVAMPGQVDVQTATLDDPDALAPTAHVQVAERIGWMADAHRLPEHERFPKKD